MTPKRQLAHQIQVVVDAWKLPWGRRLVFRGQTMFLLSRMDDDQAAVIAAVIEPLDDADLVVLAEIAKKLARKEASHLWSQLMPIFVSLGTAMQEMPDGPISDTPSDGASPVTTHSTQSGH